MGLQCSGRSCGWVAAVILLLLLLLLLRWKKWRVCHCERGLHRRDEEEDRVRRPRRGPCRAVGRPSS